MILNRHYLSLCENGCLICSPESNCLFCDFESSYHLDPATKQCTFLADVNCLEPGSDKFCHKCKDNMYFEVFTNRCREPLIYTQNCAVYANPSECLFCKKGYHLIKKNCFQLENPISNCLLQSDSEYCFKCDLEYSLSSDRKFCTKLGTNDCPVFTNANCKECKEGFFMNQQWVTNKLKKWENPDEYFVSFQNKMAYGYHFLLDDYCEPIQIEDCKQLSNSNTCKDCNPGFYLTKEQKCLKNPFEKIKYCSKYQSETRCQLCQPNYYLLNPFECVAVDPKPNCVKYDGPLCSECDSKYYLSNNSCFDRTTSLAIVNCKAVHVSKDECQECNQGYILNLNNQTCNSIILNCLTYNFTGETLKCSVCTNQQFLSGDQLSCLPGAIENCLEYSSESTCTKCKNLFYLEQNKCLPHMIISNCKTYNSAQLHECLECEDEFFLMTIEKYCEPVVQITNCQKYSAENVCEKCNEPYYLKDNVCHEITKTGCVQMNAQEECSKCGTDYFLNTSKVCEINYSHQKFYCSKSTIKEEGNLDRLRCDECMADSYLISFETMAICIESERIISKIPNCYGYVKNNNSYECVRCVDGFYLQISDKTCVAECPDVVYPIFYDLTRVDSVEVKISLIRKNQCLNEGQGCAVKAPNMSGQFSCTSCKDTHKRITLEDIWEISPQIENHTILNQGSTVKTFACNQDASLSSFPSIEAHQQNCLSYKKSSAYYCNACKHNYSSSVLLDNGNYYLTCKDLVFGCREIQYQGFHLDRSSYVAHKIFTERWFTCHQCYEENQIPFVQLLLDQNDKVTQESLVSFGYNNSTPIPLDSASKDTHLVQCYEPTPDGLLISYNNFSQDFTKNCALGLINIGVPKHYGSKVNSRHSVFCLECKPGYAKEIDTNSYTVSCNMIKNCSTSRTQNWVNNCQFCDYGYTWIYNNSKNEILFNTCELNRVKNCMIGLKNEPEKCKFCEKGYFVSPEYSFCEKLRVGHCKNFIFDQNSNGERIELKAEYISSYFYLRLYLNQFSQGCSECDDNFLLLTNQNIEQTFCTNSQLLIDHAQTREFDFIPGCQIHSGSEKKCLKCHENYIINRDSQYCYYGINLPYCKVAQDEDSCFQCYEKFYLTNNVCKQGLIENCLMYISGEPQRCTQCENDFRPTLDNLKCVQGMQSLCQVYEDTQKTSCSKCKGENNQLVSLEEESNYCFEDLTEKHKCKQMKQSSYTSGIFECEQCLPLYYKDDQRLNQTKNICVGFQKIPKCLKYDLGETFYKSSFRCTLCQMDHYVSSFGFSCSLRTLQIDFCKEKEIDSDQCSECIQGYHLRSDKLQCVTDPVGVNQCIKYLSDLICLKCAEDFYLASGNCEPIPSEKKIKNCIEYDSENKCISCNSEFFLGNGECRVPIAVNCKTLLSEKECSSCYANYYLGVNQSNKSIKDCVYKKILQCLELDLNTGKCIKCMAGFYPSVEGDCLLADEINNCLEQDTINTCVHCNQDTILSYDKKSCLPKDIEKMVTLENCQRSVFQELMICLQCPKQTYFQNGQCIKCETNIQCAYCDPTDPKVCLMCEKGYHQKEFRNQCYSNRAIIVPVLQRSLKTLLVSLFVFLLQY